MTKKLILFCDFDGTITEKDNIVDIMQHFAPPGWEKIVEDIMAQRITIRDGVGRLFATIRSSKREQIVQFVLEQAHLREGFGEFVDFTRKEGIKLLITSGGIDFFVYPKLAPYGLEDSIYCNGSDFSKEMIEIKWPHPCDDQCDVDCGMCKTSIIRSYSDDKFFKVVIGDSITDLAGAKIADYTIARSYLKEKCEELSLRHEPFEDFHDVIRIVSQLQLELQEQL